MSRLVAVLGVAALAFGLALVASAPPVATVPTAAAHATAFAGASPLATDAAPSPARAIPDGYRVQIPRLGIDLEIREGDLERDTVAQQTPEGYAFHLPGTGIPGEGRNVYLYAHARRGMFLSLWDARTGDVVWISTPDGRALRYVVHEVHPRVEPSDTSWTAATPPERLTLQTSTGPAPADPRFVVIARP